MKCVLFVFARRLECNQQLSAAYCSQSASSGHFGNDEYTESYGKTYDGYILGRCLQHRGGEPERDKGADGMQLFALDCIAYIVDADTDRVFACMNDM